MIYGTVCAENCFLLFTLAHSVPFFCSALVGLFSQTNINILPFSHSARVCVYDGGALFAIIFCVKIHVFSSHLYMVGIALSQDTITYIKIVTDAYQLIYLLLRFGSVSVLCNFWKRSHISHIHACCSLRAPFVHYRLIRRSRFALWVFRLALQQKPAGSLFTSQHSHIWHIRIVW